MNVDLVDLKVVTVDWKKIQFPITHLVQIITYRDAHLAFLLVSANIPAYLGAGTYWESILCELPKNISITKSASIWADKVQSTSICLKKLSN